MNQNLEKVYNTAFDLIELRLNKKEQVFPFTVNIQTNSIEPIIAMYGEHKGKTLDYVKKIRTQIKSEIHNKNILASCLCYDVTVNDPRADNKTDAIAFELDSQDESINIYVPYDLKSKDIIKTPFQAISERKLFS